MTSQTPLERARELLGLGRIALVGASGDERSFSRAVLRELWRRGLDVVPVHPTLREVEGHPCFARVAAIAPPVAGAILMTPPSAALGAAQDCLDAGVRALWFHRGAGGGSATPEAVALCRSRGIEPVTGLCPFMALPDAAWFHRAHRFFRVRGLRRAGAPAS